MALAGSNGLLHSYHLFSAPVESRNYRKVWLLTPLQHLGLIPSLFCLPLGPFLSLPDMAGCQNTHQMMKGKFSSNSCTCKIRETTKRYEGINKFYSLAFSRSCSQKHTSGSFCEAYVIKAASNSCWGGGSLSRICCETMMICCPQYENAVLVKRRREEPSWLMGSKINSFNLFYLFSYVSSKPD